MNVGEAAELEEYLATAVAAAQAAGDMVRARINDDLDVQHKELGLHNLVTAMDHASETLIKEMITERHGPSVFLAEESGGDEALRELTWVIDPIDGTVNYAHGIPIYCISIAAVREYEPIIGVIYNPSTGELFTAVKGRGAFLNGRRLSVSTTSELTRAIVVTGFPYNVAENPHNCVDSFIDFMKLGIPVRRLGSAALDLAYTAAGRFDAYWEISLGHWDVAAGLLMLVEAGGRVTTYASEASTQTARCPIVVDRLLATNGRIHEQVEAVLMRRAGGGGVTG